MNNKEIEKNIYQAFSNLEHEDQLSKILSDCKKTERRIVIMEEKNYSWIYRFAGLAVACVLIVAMFIGYNYTQRSNNFIAATICLDVNPSIEIQINKEEKVLNVIANNEDANKIIGDMDFKGSDLKVTVNALIGSLVRNGYINEIANSILISVNDADPNEAQSLEERLMKEISSIIDNGSILYQKVDSLDDDINKIAEKYDITLGKAQLVKEIVQTNNLYKYEDLTSLSINELNLLKKNNETNIQRNGQPSDKAYIGTDKAKEIALKNTGAKDAEVTYKKSEIDYDRQRMVYEIEFIYQGVEYEYDIDALTGEIVDLEMENINNQNQTNNTPTNNQSNNQTPTNNTTTQTTNSAIDAKQIALKHAGLKESDITNYRIKKDYDDGVVKYEIEFMVGDIEYEYDIDANNGNVIGFSKEKDDDHVQQNQKPNNNTSQVNNNTTPKPSQPAQPSQPSQPSAQANTQTIGSDTYKVEDNKVYEYDDGKWELEEDKKIENGVVYEKEDGNWQPDKKTEGNVTYEYDDDTNKWEPEKKVEGNTTYEYDDDTNTWQPDEKVENGQKYEYDDDTNTWELDDDDHDDHDDDHDDDDYDDEDDD